MTSMDRDTKIQDELLKNDYGFFIDNMFWDDIQEVIYRDKKLLEKYCLYFYHRQNINIESLKRVIASLKDLKTLAHVFSSQFKNYRVAINESDDIATYNKCIDVNTVNFNFERI